MGLWDFIKPNKKDILKEYADNMQPLQPIQQDLPLIQVDGGAQVGTSAPVQNKRLTLAERLFGQQATPTDNIDPNTMNVTVSNNPRVGGLFNDITAGAKENYATGFAAPNLFEKQTSDGRNKGFAYRLGEGLGTAGRLLESPLGRGLITAGIVGATGGKGLEALAYGGMAGMLNQQNRMKDKYYRQQMINSMQNSLRNDPNFNTLSDKEKQSLFKQLLTDSNGVIRDYNTMSDADKAKLQEEYNTALSNALYQKQQMALDDITNNVNNIRGYVGDDTFKQLLNSQILQDNAEFKRMYYDNQQKQNEIMNQFRQDQAEYQKLKDEADRSDRAATRALTARGQDLNYAGTMARINADERKAANKQSAKMQDAQSTLNQIGIIRDMVRRNPKATGLGKGMLTGDLLNRFDNKKSNIETRSAIDALRTKIRHDLTGAQFSPKEAREYEKFLPNVRDNAQIINAKLDALEKRYYSDFGVSLTGNSGARKVGKYTVRVK